MAACHFDKILDLFKNVKIPQNVSGAAFAEWLMGVSDSRLRQILSQVHHEGVRRGWGEYWSE